MITMGDEYGRTQQGNNNAYCQDNEISWFNWDDVDDHAGLRRFVRNLIRLRALRQNVAGAPRLSLAELIYQARIELHGIELTRPDLSHGSRSLALSATNLEGDLLMHFMLNAYWKPLDFELPPPPQPEDTWRRVLDTSLHSPDDIRLPGDAPEIATSHYRVGPRTVAVTFAGRFDALADPPE